MIRLIGYTIIPHGHSWLILALELLHGFTYAGTITIVAQFAELVIPDDQHLQDVAQRFVSLFRGKVMTAAVFYGACRQQQIGPTYMYRQAAVLVLLSVLCFGLGIIMDHLHSVSPTSSSGMEGSLSPSSSDTDAGSKLERDDTGPTQRRPSLDTLDYFQDRDTSDFEKGVNMTIEWANSPRKTKGMHYHK